ncbi:MAG: ligase-associated DNA damage response endonuclease PdeM [Pseudomonadota bacterium]
MAKDDLGMATEDRRQTLEASPTIKVNGEQLVLLPAGAAYWPVKETLIVSDMHFEKGSSYAVDGVMLPPYDTRSTLRRLTAIVDELTPKTIISLGDAFHDRGAEKRMNADDVSALSDLTKRAHWVWIAGNHDPAPPDHFSGETTPSMRLEGLFFTHEPESEPEPGEIAGHLHPCARVATGHHFTRRRCFATDGNRLIMPSFGTYTGGLNVLDAGFEGLFDQLTAWVMGRRGVYGFSRRKLMPDSPPVLRAGFARSG